MANKRKVLLPALIGVVLAGVIFGPKGCEEKSEELDEIAVIDSTELREVVYKYGLPVDNYNVNYGVVKKGQSLSTILSAHGLSMGEIHDLNQKAKDVFDSRKIKLGQDYAVFLPQDSLTIDSVLITRPEFFVYESSQRDYVVYDLRKDFKVYTAQHPVEWKTKTVKGQVESSLWNAMPNYGADPLLAVKLSDIYAWTIDFFGIAKGDEFRVLYDEEYIEDRPLKEFNVKGAYFKHQGADYYAIPFEQDGYVSYYDETGKNVEKAFLKAPLNFFRITSKFTNSRYHPVLKRYRAHHGVDYAAPTGTPVFSIGDGTVVAKGFQANGGGNYVKIKHNGSYQTSYMHLSGFAKGLKVGSRVRQKEVIGYVGSTGLSTGPHLDFRVYKDGTPVNPLTIKSEPKEAIRAENMERFAAVRDTVVVQLRNLQ
ncbi:MAG: peptidoglycan DD-metalloendopeptidase family protein [Marinifilaceae bacterium]